MPACAASSMVADTVVAPFARAAITAGRSRRDVLRTRLPLRSRQGRDCINVLPGSDGFQLESGEHVGTASSARGNVKNANADKLFMPSISQQVSLGESQAVPKLTCTHEVDESASLDRAAPRGDAVQLLCCEANVWGAFQDRYGRRGCAVVPDDALHLCAPGSRKCICVLELHLCTQERLW